MAQFFWKPDPLDEGFSPADLTIVQPWAPFDVIWVDTEDTASESHSLHFNVTASGGRMLAIFDEIDGVTVPEAKDQEVWMKVVASGSANNTYAPLRCDRNTGISDATGYARVGLTRRDSTAEIARYVNGTNTQLASDASLDQGFNVYGQRARIEDSGTDARIRLKVWVWDDGQPDGGEPAAWDLDYTDTSPIDAAGAVGFFVFDGTTGFDGRVVAWGYGTDGDSAPNEPVSSVQTATASTAWSVRTANTRDAAWATQAAIAAPTAWTIRESASKETAWLIGEILTAFRDTAWAVRVDASKGTAWRIGTLAVSKDTAWAIRNSADKASVWAIRHASPQVLAWALRIQNTRPTVWAIQTVISQETQWRYLLGISLSSAWAVRTAQSKAAAWRIGDQWTVVTSDPATWVVVTSDPETWIKV